MVGMYGPPLLSAGVGSWTEHRQEGNTIQRLRAMIALALLHLGRAFFCTNPRGYLGFVPVHLELSSGALLQLFPDIPIHSLPWGSHEGLSSPETQPMEIVVRSLLGNSWG